MSISIINNYELNASIFLDNRRSIASLNDLKRISQAQDILYPHGFEVFCVQEGSYYVNVSPQGKIPEWKLRLINDEEPSFVSTYSSQKISELLQNLSEDENIGINDSEPSPVRVYSSQKVESIVAELRQETTRVDDDLLDIDTRVEYLEGEMWKLYGFDGSYDSLTNKPSLEDYATKEYVDETVANAQINGGSGGSVDLSDYATKEYVDDAVGAIDTDNLVVTNSISMGRKENTTIGEKSTALGSNVEASGLYSYAEGDGTTASGDVSHAEGDYTTASAIFSHAEGYTTTASGDVSHAEGHHTEASGSYSHAEGNSTKAIGSSSHAEGEVTTANGKYSHAEGYYAKASGEASHAEGYYTEASGTASHAEGYYTIASEYDSHAEGYYTIASAYDSHAEGCETIASGEGSHAEGNSTKAMGSYSHAEGCETIASGASSHSEGNYTKASGHYSHAEGHYTIASSEYQHVQGKYNIEDSANTYAHIVGNGDENTRSNAHTLDWDGNAWFAGNISIGADNKELATKEYVDEVIANNGGGSGGSGGNIDLSGYATKEYVDNKVKLPTTKQITVDTVVNMPWIFFMSSLINSRKELLGCELTFTAMVIDNTETEEYHEETIKITFTQEIIDGLYSTSEGLDYFLIENFLDAEERKNITGIIAFYPGQAFIIELHQGDKVVGGVKDITLTKTVKVYEKDTLIDVGYIEAKLPFYDYEQFIEPSYEDNNKFYFYEDILDPSILKGAKLMFAIGGAISSSEEDEVIDIVQLEFTDEVYNTFLQQGGMYRLDQMLTPEENSRNLYGGFMFTEEDGQGIVFIILNTPSEESDSIYYKVPEASLELKVKGYANDTLVDKEYVDNTIANIHSVILKVSDEELNFIEQRVSDTLEYDNSLTYITRSDLSSIIDNNADTVIFEGYERYPYKVVGAYYGFNYSECVILERAVSDSSDDCYVVHRLVLTYSNDMGTCYLKSYSGDLANSGGSVDLSDYATKKYVDDSMPIKILPYVEGINNNTQETVLYSDIDVSTLEGNCIYMTCPNNYRLRLRVATQSGTFINIYMSYYPNNIQILVGTKTDELIELIIKDKVYVVHFATETEEYRLETTPYFLANNNTTAYTPTADYHPATKKYVDEAIANGSGGNDSKIVEIDTSSWTELFEICRGLEDGTICYLKSYGLYFTYDTNATVIVRGYYILTKSVYYVLQGITSDFQINLSSSGFVNASKVSLDRNNTYTYTPTNDYNPATKKYVDDAVANNDGGSGLPLLSSICKKNEDGTLYKQGAYYCLDFDLIPKDVTKTYYDDISTSLGVLYSCYLSLYKDESLLSTAWLSLRSVYPLVSVGYRTANQLLSLTNSFQNVTYDLGTNTRTLEETYSITSKAPTSSVLTKTNTTEYTPTADYHPATKKYVDDAVANLSELKMNIVNGLTFANAYINYNNGDYISGGGAYACQEYIPVISGATYEVSGVSNIVRIAYYDSSKAYINQYVDNTPTFSFTPPSNASYIRVHVESSAWQDLSIASEVEDYIRACVNNATSGGSGNIDLSLYALKTDLHSHSNKSVIDTITSDMFNKWNQAIPFNDTYASDCNAWLTNGYIKTGAGQTSNLPSACTGSDRWGILFFIAENVAQGTGTQMYFPIDGTYKGRIFTRSLTNMKASGSNVGEWNLVSVSSTNAYSLANESTIPTISDVSASINEGYVDGLLAKMETLEEKIKVLEERIRTLEEGE